MLVLRLSRLTSRQSVSKRSIARGSSVVILTASTGGRSAVTRASNGRIPGASDSLTQTTVTLTEAYDKDMQYGFDMFAAQSNLQEIMRANNMIVMKKAQDLAILAQADTATQATNTTGQTATVDMWDTAKVILGNNGVDFALGEVYAVVSHAFFSYLRRAPEFSSADYVDVKPYAGAASRKMLVWDGITIIRSSLLTGVTTSSEKCYMFHRNALAYAYDPGMIDIVGEYVPEDDYSYSRAKIYHGAKLLQNTGIVQMLHDGSAYTAA